MATPKTRIPKALRQDVWQALCCFRDYLAAIDNLGGATAICDLARVLGLEPLTESNRFHEKYWNPKLREMLRDVEKYGPR